MRVLMQVPGAALLLALQLTMTAPLLLAATPASAAEGDFCFYDGTRPGALDATNACVADPAFTADGQACGTTGLNYNVATGTCQSTSGPITQPTNPAAPVGFTLDPNAGGAPTGEMQPMCVNASPFIGGGMFVVSGTVLCYTGAGRNSGIYGYSSDENSSGWDPTNPSSWDSLALTNVFASDDVTVAGTLSVFGGAQIYSLNGRNGIQVNDDGVLVRAATTGGVEASVATNPGQIVASATDGTSTSGIAIDGTKGINIYGQIGSTSTDRVGVVISGDGQGNAAAPTSGPAGWADVLVASKSYDGNAGTAVIVNDYGMTAANGGTSMTMIQGALDFGTSGGTSTLIGATQQVSGGSSTVLGGAAGRHVVMDDSGRMTVVNGVAPEASSSMHVTNGYGTTNGVMANEHGAAISGGTSNATTMALTDGGARFSDANGGPVTVSGIADGQGPMDAANIRQLDGGLASIAALAGIPAPQGGKNNSFGMGMGYHGSGTAIALGGQSLLGESFTVKYGASVSHSGGLIDSSATLGIGMSW